MRLSIILGAVIAALVAGGVIWHLSERNADLRAENREQAATIRNHEEAARVLNDVLRNERRIREDLETALSETENLEGADDALSPYGRAILDRVR
jgi:pantothenate synthetase